MFLKECVSAAHPDRLDLQGGQNWWLEKDIIMIKVYFIHRQRLAFGVLHEHETICHNVVVSSTVLSQQPWV